MYPILIDSPYLLLPAWHAFYVLGALSALFLLRFLGRRWHPEIEERHLNSLFVVCYVSGYFGARLLSIIVEEDWQQGPVFVLTRLFQLGAMTFYGGFVGGVLGGWALTRRLRLNPAKIWDISFPCLMLALAFGRIGCFLNGDDFGVPVQMASDGSAPWYGVVFPNLQDGVHRIPSQLIETFAALVILLFIVKIGDRLNRKSPGFVAATGLVSYSVYRFFAEYLRADYRGWVFDGILSTSQFISILVAIGTMAWLLRRLLTHRNMSV